MADRVLAVSSLAVRRRCRGIPGAEALERDGLVLSLTNLTGGLTGPGRILVRGGRARRGASGAL